MIILMMIVIMMITMITTNAYHSRKELVDF